VRGLSAGGLGRKGIKTRLSVYKSKFDLFKKKVGKSSKGNFRPKSGKEKIQGENPMILFQNNFIHPRS
jgi:hypothetical protein